MRKDVCSRVRWIRVWGKRRLTSHSVVLAITKGNIDARPTLFTTYDTSASFHGCAIWQVARATSAATTFFKSITVGRDGIEFIDAGFGYNNPCEVLIEEARRQFPGHGQMRVLSIGTGLGDVGTIDNRRLSIINGLKKMATTSKKVAARLDGQYGDSGQYYRFNVDQGLQDITLSDWGKASKISSHTHNYLSENQRTIKKLVDDFASIVQAEERYDGETSLTMRSGAVDEDRSRPQDMPSTAPRVETQMAAAAAAAAGELGGAPSS